MIAARTRPTICMAPAAKLVPSKVCGLRREHAEGVEFWA